MQAHSLQLDAQTAFAWSDGDPAHETRIVLQVPGRHNVLNALAAATVATLLHVPVAAIADGLRAFHGATRRQEILGEVALEGGDVLVMDDYAHHPTEIRATLDALRSAYPQRRLIAVFQPHLYSRTRDFLAPVRGGAGTGRRPDRHRHLRRAGDAHRRRARRRHRESGAASSTRTRR